MPCGIMQEKARVRLHEKTNINTEESFMYCVRKVLEDLWWVGGNDRRLAMFEGVYAVPNGVSYNSYLLLDDKTVLFDTVDPSVSKVFFENVDHVLAGRKLDYLVIHHMEPDHSGTVSEVLLRHPETVIVCSDRIRAMLQQFRGGVAPQNAFHLVKEGDTFETGHHTLTFLSAPMVHWPEVMVSYDLTTRTLFSARSARSTARCSPMRSTSSATMWTRPAAITATSSANTARRCRPCSRRPPRSRSTASAPCTASSGAKTSANSSTATSTGAPIPRRSRAS